LETTPLKFLIPIEEIREMKKSQLSTYQHDVALSFSDSRRFFDEKNSFQWAMGYSLPAVEKPLNLPADES
jgi:hypothetical protein